MIMRTRGYVYLSAFGVLILAIGLACGPVTTVTTPQVVVVTATAAPVNTATVITAPATDAASTTTSGTGQVTTFTDQSKFFAIDVPSDWVHTTGTASHAYSDTFTSPDKHAFIESVVYDDGTVWSGSQSGAAALQLLNQYYSNTKKEGDIKVSEDSIQQDGSERLTWISKSGGYSGVSFFEVRNRTSFLMFTNAVDNAYTDQYRTLLDNVVSSYRTP